MYYRILGGFVMNYSMEIAGIKRDLPLFPINESLQIAAFIMFGDTEITVASANELIKKAPEFDVLITAECKGIPLAYEMSRISGKKYIVARKKPKLYMSDIVSVNVNSITTEGMQTLCIGGEEASQMKGKRVLIVDDVISTGESLDALQSLVEAAGGNIVGKMAVLAEGDAISRDDIIYLEPLPLFDKNGNVI